MHVSHVTASVLYIENELREEKLKNLVELNSKSACMISELGTL